MTEIKPKRRWFSFSLRALLVVVTMAAVGSWACWVAWPWWQAYREQAQFEAAVRQLKIGDPNLLDNHLLPTKNNDSWFSTGDGKFLYLTGKFIRSTFSYCIVCTARTPKPMTKFDWVNVSVYRLNHAPPNYQPYRDHDCSAFKEYTSGWSREIKYVFDFADFILGDAEDGRHFEYELIYSDPPAKPRQLMVQNSGDPMNPLK